MIAILDAVLMLIAVVLFLAAAISAELRLRVTLLALGLCAWALVAATPYWTAVL